MVRENGTVFWAVAGRQPGGAGVYRLLRMAGEGDRGGRPGTSQGACLGSEEARDLRGMVRSRLALRRHPSSFQCRIHAVLSHYGRKQWVEDEQDVIVRDWFTAKSRDQLSKAI